MGTGDTSRPRRVRYRKDGGDVSWLAALRKKLELSFEVQHWGHRHLQALFLDDPTLCLYYYPELLPEGQAARRTIQDLRTRYNAALEELYREIRFVGVAVREQKTAQGVPMQDIYIPLKLLPEGIREDAARRKPFDLLASGARNVVLGDPGSGKSTLLRFLALAGQFAPLQARYGASPDDRLPVLVILRRYAHELGTRRNLALRDYIVETMKADLSLPVDDRFLDYYLESGQTVLLFDGLDELPDSKLRNEVRDRIATFLKAYPHNTAMVTSRFVGYEGPVRFRKEDFGHYQVAPLRLPEMERFVADWYMARIANEAERLRSVNDLVGILRDEKHEAIRELAQNPLLLTIIALVHRIEADLPDERVLLYKKCTETLLSTWHNYKFADVQDKKPGRIERRNLYRIEAIAHWMQRRGAGDKRERAVAPYGELRKFLTSYIKNEEPEDKDHEPDQLADIFLRFVREKAGLLIEAGKDLYSFVHLTFQEYLTAEFLKRRAGEGGVDAVWNDIQAVRDEPRWHEVLRLLIAGYENPKAEAILVERILGEQKRLAKPCVELLGGLLLDSVVAAEERQDRIVPHVIQACVEAASGPELVRPLQMLQVWVPRSEGNAATFERALNPAALPNQELLRELVKPGDPPQSSAIRFFLGEQPRREDLAQYTQLLRRVRYCDPWALRSYQGNFVVSLTQAFGEMEWGPALRDSFERLLLLGLNSGIQMAHYHTFSSLAGGDGLLRHPHRLGDGDGDRARARRTVLAWIVERSPDRDMGSGRLPDPDFAAVRTADSGWWDALLVTPDACEPLLATWKRVFEVQPAALWAEFLRVRVLPTLPKRIRLHDRTLWEETTRKVASSAATETDLWRAARHLLVDANLWVLDVYKNAEESPLQRLAELTRGSTFPAIRIAHCIRDISYGDTSRAAELRQMIEYPDPEYGSIFREAYWID